MSGIYVGGYFDVLSGAPRRFIGAISPRDGSPTPWKSDADGFVRALAIANGTIYVGGEFTTLGNAPEPYLAALNLSDGMASSELPELDGYVYSLLPTGQSVFVGGTFSAAGNRPRSNLVAIRAVMPGPRPEAGQLLAFPNPFRTLVSIRLRLSVSERVELQIFDLAGRRVRRLNPGIMPAGLVSLEWDGRDERGERSPAGLYLLLGHIGSHSIRGRVLRIN